MARWLAAVVLALMAIGIADCLLRWHVSAARWLASAAFVSIAAAAGYRWLWPTMRYRTTAAAAARRIEQRFPDLKEWLTSAAAFLAESEHDPTAGSPALRR